MNTKQPEVTPTSTPSSITCAISRNYHITSLGFCRSVTGTHRYIPRAKNTRSSRRSLLVGFWSFVLGDQSDGPRAPNDWHPAAPNWLCRHKRVGICRAPGGLVPFETCSGFWSGSVQFSPLALFLSVECIANQRFQHVCFTTEIASHRACRAGHHSLGLSAGRWPRRPCDGHGQWPSGSTPAAQHGRS